MKWPFVLRSTHERAVDEYLESIRAMDKQSCAILADAHKDEDARERRRVAELTEAHLATERLREQNITLNARYVAIEGALERQNGRYDALMDKYHSLKVIGATEPPPVVARPASTADDLDRALSAAVAGLPPNLRRAAQRQLVEDRVAIEAGFLTVDQVLSKMRRGVSLDGVPAGGTLEDVVS